MLRFIQNCTKIYNNLKKKLKKPKVVSLLGFLTLFFSFFLFFFCCLWFLFGFIWLSYFFLDFPFTYWQMFYILSSSYLQNQSFKLRLHKWGWYHFYLRSACFVCTNRLYFSELFCTFCLTGTDVIDDFIW